jgi:hypothetical protein
MPENESSGGSLLRGIVTALVAVCALALVFPRPGKPAEEPARPTFRDIASRSQFSYISNNSFQGRKFFPQPMCGGVAVFDYDRDGLLDIFFTNGAQMPEMKKVDPSYYNRLLRQKPDGTFEDVTERAGLAGADLDFNFGVAAGDYDNDGYPDLFLAAAGRNTLYHNNGDGTFTDVTEASGIGAKPKDTLSVVAAWFDYDRDGLPDLVVSNYTIWTPKIDHRCTMGEKDFYCDPRRYPSVPHRLYRNLGKGRFADVTEQTGLAAAPGKGMGISIADFNDDGFLRRQRHRPELPLPEPRRQEVRGGGPAGRRGLQRQRADRLVDGQRRQGLRQRRQGGHLLQQPDGPGLGPVAEPGRRAVPACFPLDQSAEAEPAVFGLEQRLHRLRQRRLEGHLLLQR